MKSASELGKFITFEGGEGAGKSTQVRILADRLRGEFGLDVVVTREPGGSPIGEKIRDLVLEQRPRACEAEFLLFAAARAEHVAVTIAPALGAGKWVICDRFIDSSRVYQGVMGSVAPEFIASVEAYTVAPYMPNLTLIMDLCVDVGMDRARARGALSRYDAAGRDEHEVLRGGFLEIARREPRRCVVVDGAQGERDVAGDVFAAVQSRLLSKT